MDLEDFELVELNVPDIRFGHINIYCSLTDKELLIMEKTRRSTSKEDHAFSCMQAEERLKIQHDNILRMLWVDKDDSKWLANAYFEYPNEDLFDRQEKLKDPKELIRLMNDMLEAMAYLQRHKMVHGDFRPEYVYFNYSLNKYVLLDRLIDASPANQAQMNNIFYQDKALFMSPAMFDTLSAGQVKVRHNPFKSEVFSLGMVIISLFIDESEILKCYDRRTKCFDVDHFRHIEEHLKKSVFVGHIEDLIGEYLFLCVLNLDEKQRLTPKKALKILRKGVCRVLDSLGSQATSQNADKPDTVTETNTGKQDFSSLVQRKPLEIDQLLTPSETTVSVQMPSQMSNGFDMTGMPNMGKGDNVSKGEKEEKVMEAKETQNGAGKLHEFLLNNSISYTNNETFYGSGSNQNDGLAGLNDIYDPNVRKLKDFLNDGQDLVMSRETSTKGDAFQIIPPNLASPDPQDKHFQSCQNFIGQDSPPNIKKVIEFQSQQGGPPPFPEIVPEVPEQVQESIFRGKPEDDFLNEMHGSEYHINESDLGLKRGSEVEDGEVFARGGSPVQSPPLMQLKMAPRSGDRGYFSYGKGEESGPEDFNFSKEQTGSRKQTSESQSHSTVKEVRNLQSLKRDSLNIDFKTNNLEYVHGKTMTSHMATPSITENSNNHVDSEYGLQEVIAKDYRFPEKKSDISGNLSSNSQYKSYSIGLPRASMEYPEGRSDAFNQTEGPSMTDTFDREMRKNMFSEGDKLGELDTKFEKEHSSLGNHKSGNGTNATSSNIQNSLERNQLHVELEGYETRDLRNSISVDSEESGEGRLVDEPEEQEFSVSPASHDLTDSTERRLTGRQTGKERVSEQLGCSEVLDQEQEKVEEVGDRRIIEVIEMESESRESEKSERNKKNEDLHIIHETPKAESPKNAKLNNSGPQEEIKFIKNLITGHLKQMKKEVANNLVTKMTKSHKTVSVKSLFEEIALEKPLPKNGSSLSDDESENLPIGRSYAFSEKKMRPRTDMDSFNFTSEIGGHKKRQKHGISPIFMDTFGKNKILKKQKESKEVNEQNVLTPRERGVIDKVSIGNRTESKKQSMEVSSGQGIVSVEVFLSENEKLKIEELLEENKNLNTMELLEISKKFLNQNTLNEKESEASQEKQNTEPHLATAQKSVENKSIQTSSHMETDPFKSEKITRNSQDTKTLEIETFKSGDATKNYIIPKPKYRSEMKMDDGPTHILKTHKSEPKRTSKEKEQKRNFYDQRDSRSEEAISEDIYLSNNLVEGKGGKQGNLEEAILGPIKVDGPGRFDGDGEQIPVENAFHMGTQFGTISEASEDYGSDASFLKEAGQRKGCKIFKTGSGKGNSRSKERKVDIKEKVLKSKMAELDDHDSKEINQEKTESPQTEIAKKNTPTDTQSIKKTVENKSMTDKGVNEAQYQTDKTDFSNFKIGFEIKESENFTEDVTRKSENQSRFDSALFPMKNSEFASPSTQLLKVQVRGDFLLSKISEGGQSMKVDPKAIKMNQTDEILLEPKVVERDVVKRVSTTLQGTIQYERLKKTVSMDIEECDICPRLERFKELHVEELENEKKSEQHLENLQQEKGIIEQIPEKIQEKQEKNDTFLPPSPPNQPKKKPTNQLPKIENLEIKEVTGYHSGLFQSRDITHHYPQVSPYHSNPELTRTRQKTKFSEPEDPNKTESHKLKESLLRAKVYLDEESNFSSTGKKRFQKKKNMIHVEMNRQEEIIKEDELIEHHLGEEYFDEEGQDPLYIVSEQNMPMDRLSMGENRKFLVCSDQGMNLKLIRNDVESGSNQEEYEEVDDGHYESQGLRGNGSRCSNEEIGDFDSENDEMIKQSNMNEEVMGSFMSIKEGESNYLGVDQVQRQSFMQIQNLENSFEPVFLDPEDEQEIDGNQVEEDGNGQSEENLEGENDETDTNLDAFGNEFSEDEDLSIEDQEREQMHQDLEQKTYSMNDNYEESGDSDSDNDEEQSNPDEYETYNEQNKNDDSEYQVEVSLTNDGDFTTEQEDDGPIIQTKDSRVTGFSNRTSPSPPLMKELAGIPTTVSRFAKNQSVTVNFTDQQSSKAGDSKINNYTQEFINQEIGFRKSEPIVHHLSNRENQRLEQYQLEGESIGFGQDVVDMQRKTHEIKTQHLGEEGDAGVKQICRDEVVRIHDYRVVQNLQNVQNKQSVQNMLKIENVEDKHNVQNFKNVQRLKTPRKQVNRVTEREYKERSVYDIIKHYSKEKIIDKNTPKNETINEKLPVQKLDYTKVDQSKELLQTSLSQRVVNIQTKTEMLSSRTFRESLFKTEGISEPPSRSIILSKQVGVEHTKNPNHEMSFGRNQKLLQKNFESPIISNTKFAIKKEESFKKTESSIPEQMVVSRVIDQPDRDNRFNIQQNASRNRSARPTLSPSRVDNDSSFSQNIKYRGPVIRSRSKSSRIQKEQINQIKQSLVSKDSRFSPKPAKTSQNIFGNSMSKSIRVERRTDNTRRTRMTDNSMRTEDRSPHRPAQQMKDTLFTQHPMTQSKYMDNSEVFNNAPSQQINQISEPVEQPSYSSIKTQEKYPLKNSRHSRNNYSPVAIKRVSRNVSRSPTSNTSFPRTIVVEEERFGLRIRRKSTEPVKPPERRVSQTRVDWTSRFKSPKQPMNITFETNKLVKPVDDLGKVSDVQKKSHWVQSQSSRVVESRVIEGQKMSQLSERRREYHSPVYSVGHRQGGQMVTSQSKVQYTSKQIQSKISKLSDKIQSQISYFINTKPSHVSEKNISSLTKVSNISRMSNLSKVSNIFKVSSPRIASNVQNSQISVVRISQTRSPSPRIIRKTQHPLSIKVPTQVSTQIPAHALKKQKYSPVMVQDSKPNTTKNHYQNTSHYSNKMTNYITKQSSGVLRESRFKSPVRVVQSLPRGDSPFRTRKTKVIRVEHSRSLERVTRKSDASGSYRVHQNVHQPHVQANQHIIITKPQETEQKMTKKIIQAPRTPTNQKNIQKLQKVNSGFKTSKDILARKQKSFHNQRVQQDQKNSLRFGKEKKKEESKRGTLEPGVELDLGLSAMKTSRDGVNLVMYNTPSFDNVKFESNLSRMSQFGIFQTKGGKK